MSAPLKIDLHVHTCYSYDAFTSLKEVIAYCKKRGLDGVAVTDHDTIEGALKLAKTREIIVIPGIEVETLQGHLLALNVTMPLPFKLSSTGVIERVHEAGGIAVACHPTSFYKLGWKPQILRSSNLDAIEVINSSTFPFSLSTYLNRKLAVRLNLPQTAGSDSHIPETIGTAYTLIEAESKVEEIIQAIREGATVPQGKAIPLRARFKKVFLGVKRGFRAQSFQAGIGSGQPSEGSQAPRWVQR